MLKKVLKQRILLFKALVLNSFSVVGNISLSGRVIDTQLWMPDDGFWLAPTYQSTNSVI